DADGPAHEEHRGDDVGDEETDRDRDAEHHQPERRAEQDQGDPVPSHQLPSVSANEARKFSSRTTKRRNSMPIIRNPSGIQPTIIQRGMSNDRTSFSLPRKSASVMPNPYQAMTRHTAMHARPMKRKSHLRAPGLRCMKRIST